MHRTGAKFGTDSLIRFLFTAQTDKPMLTDTHIHSHKRSPYPSIR